VHEGPEEFCGPPRQHGGILDQVTVAAVGCQLRQAPYGGSENGYTEAHGLQGDERQPLRLGGENERIAIKSLGGIKAIAAKITS
jgi:hypothetical protein